ncbi:hypothetical protein ACH4C2_13360 [Streptomyces sp. NPDC018057]|uniref:hypothetical protein n=1 Tax=unclassified Streptomyces TaxID=2593676 RepID=UPI00378D8FDA
MTDPRAAAGRMLSYGEDARERRVTGHTVHSAVTYGNEVADAIQIVEREGWRLDHVNAYGQGLGMNSYALLVFRKNNA